MVQPQLESLRMAPFHKPPGASQIHQVLITDFHRDSREFTSVNSGEQHPWTMQAQDSVHTRFTNSFTQQR